MSLAVFILTYNEQKHIARAIRSVAEIAEEVIVVDSYSTDSTVSISKELGAIVLQRKFLNQADQLQWALDNYETKCAWILRLDADEIIEPDLAREIKLKLSTLPQEVTGVNLKRKHIFFGRWIKFGGRYPLLLLRIWRTGVGRIEQRWMDEHAVVDYGTVVTFEGGFSDFNLNDLSYFIAKHNNYATREAVAILNNKYTLFNEDQLLEKGSSSKQARIKRYIKLKIYNILPFYISSTLYFVWRYFFQLGFLDGSAGLIYHFLQGWWYRFLVGAKAKEFDEVIRAIASKEEKLAILSVISGLPLKACK